MLLGAPAVPAAYWEKLQQTVARRLALAGYRIANLVIAAFDRIETDQSLAIEAANSAPGH